MPVKDDILDEMQDLDIDPAVLKPKMPAIANGFQVGEMAQRSVDDSFAFNAGAPLGAESARQVDAVMSGQLAGAFATSPAAQAAARSGKAGTRSIIERPKTAAQISPMGLNDKGGINPRTGTRWKSLNQWDSFSPQTQQEIRAIAAGTMPGYMAKSPNALAFAQEAAQYGVKLYQGPQHVQPSPELVAAAQAQLEMAAKNRTTMPAQPQAASAAPAQRQPSSREASQRAYLKSQYGIEDANADLPTLARRALQVRAQQRQRQAKGPTFGEGQMALSMQESQAAEGRMAASAPPSKALTFSDLKPFINVPERPVGLSGLPMTDAELAKKGITPPASGWAGEQTPEQEAQTWRDARDRHQRFGSIMDGTEASAAPAAAPAPPDVPGFPKALPANWSGLSDGDKRKQVMAWAHAAKEAGMSHEEVARRIKQLLGAQ